MSSEFKKIGSPDESKKTYVTENIDKLKMLRSWIAFYPDLFLDLCKPKKGGMNLGFDQRVSMRCDARFFRYNGVFPRGSSKTFNQFIVAFIMCICYGGHTMRIGMTAQTKENSAKLIAEKYTELVKWYPQLENEVADKSFTKNDSRIILKNGAQIFNVANNDNFKGGRLSRIRNEEVALMDYHAFADAVEPALSGGDRITGGVLSIVDPTELNGQINSYTTSGFRGTDAYNAAIQAKKDMLELDGTMSLGSDWMLPCWYGRGNTKSSILKLKKTRSPVVFAQNYGSEWVGAVDGALISMGKIMKCRTLTSALISPEDGDEIYMAFDVARSYDASRNKSSMAIARVKRNDVGRVCAIELGNLFNVSNSENFLNQAVLIKKAREKYKAKVCVVDANGLGIGLVDTLLQKNYDPLTDTTYECFGSINTPNQSEDPQHEIKCLFEMKSQQAQTQIISCFIDSVESGTLRLLEQRDYDIYSAKDDDEAMEKYMPFVQTDLLIGEIANLKLKVNGKNLSIEQEVKRIDKDRVSALIYLIYYILTYENNPVQQSYDYTDIFSFRAPVLRAE